METRSTQYRPDNHPERMAPRKRTMMWLIDTREISNIACVVRSGALQILLTRAEYDHEPEYQRYQADEPNHGVEALAHRKNAAPTSRPRLTAK